MNRAAQLLGRAGGRARARWAKPKRQGRKAAA